MKIFFCKCGTVGVSSILNLAKLGCFEGKGMAHSQLETTNARPYKLSNCSISCCLGPVRRK